MFKFGQFFLILMLTFLTIFIACTDNPLEVGADNELNAATQVMDTVLYAIADTTILGDTEVATQFSTRLMTGEFNGIKSRLLLRFTSLPESANFESVKIKFAADGYQGAENPASFTGKAYPILTDWESNVDSVWSDYLSNINSDTLLGEMIFTATGDDSMIMNQDGIDRFTFWANPDHYGDNFGLLIDIENPTFMKYMRSRNGSDFPRLYFTYNTADDTTMRTDSLEAAWDAFLYEGEQNKIDNRNYASTLSINRTLLKFDLDGFSAKFPDGVEVVSANLEVPVDKANSIIDTSYGEKFFVWKLLSSLDSSAVRVDEISGRFVSLSEWDESEKYLELSADGSRKTFARALIQPQLFGLKDNVKHGLVIDTQDETVSVTSFAFYKRNETDPALRPRLKLIYHLPSSPRF